MTHTGNTDEEIFSSVKEYYQEVLHTSKDLKTSACTASSRPHPRIARAIRDIPIEIREKFYGCGTPIPLGIEGLNVLDLGSGSGRDVYLASRFVGPNGHATGIDMSPAQLNVARQHVDKYTKEVLGFNSPNMSFYEGYIEKLDHIENDSQDLVISNCVINLSPRKDEVLRQVYRVLRNGGEFYFSDVYSSRRLSEQARQNKILYGECISGALYVNDFLRISHDVGFQDVRRVSSEEISIHDEELRKIIGPSTRFFSITYRLFKLKSLEPDCEDYGQIARYKGTIEGHEYGYRLDDTHMFETGKWATVCGNTASMLSETYLGKHFEVLGDRSVHYGVFDCSVPCGGNGGEEMVSNSNSKSPSCCAPSSSTTSSCCS